MSQTTTLILLPETAYVNPGNASPYTVTGNGYPAAAYYLGNKDLQTVNMKVTNCTGNIVIEATLSSNAQTNEYFEVYKSSNNANANLSMYTNIDGNFVYMRAKIEDFQAGGVQFVKLSY